MFAPDSPVGLVADIGGTNARFALAGFATDGTIATALRQSLQASDYPTLEDCVAAYLDSVGAAPRPTIGAFGVASPVTGDHIRLTNHDWSFSIQAVAARFGWSELKVVNDFAVVGHALPALGRADFHSLAGPQWPLTLPPIVSLIGPGTGLGVGAAVIRPGGCVVLPTEGGHASFAPLDPLDMQLLKSMLARFPHVSNERILSGPGLEALYVAMADVRGQVANLMTAPAILSAAVAGNDTIARETVDRFCLIMGGVMGDVALTHGAGAVAIAGGIIPRMIATLDTPAVRARFEAKGRAQALMRTIPIALITHPEPALLGASRLLFGLSS